MSSATTRSRRQLQPIRFEPVLSGAPASAIVAPLLDRAAPPVADTPRNAEPERPSPEFVKSFRNGKQTRIWRAKLAEHGHSLAEQAVYTALWNAAAPAPDDHHRDSRTVRIGYHRLAQITRLSWVSVKANLRSLEKKLAIEVIASENSAAQEGKQYLVYSEAAIMERRKGAGLEWVRRTRGVELLTQPSGVEQRRPDLAHKTS